jgi:hypothetical protein
MLLYISMTEEDAVRIPKEIAEGVDALNDDSRAIPGDDCLAA